MATPTKRLAEMLLAERTDAVTVDQFIADRRTAGQAWRRIALDLRDLTEGQIDVTPETVRNWALAAQTAA